MASMRWKKKEKKKYQLLPAPLRIVPNFAFETVPVFFGSMMAICLFLFHEDCPAFPVFRKGYSITLLISI